MLGHIGVPFGGFPVQHKPPLEASWHWQYHESLLRRLWSQIIAFWWYLKISYIMRVYIWKVDEVPILWSDTIGVVYEYPNKSDNWFEPILQFTMTRLDPSHLPLCLFRSCFASFFSASSFFSDAFEIMATSAENHRCSLKNKSLFW